MSWGQYGVVDLGLKGEPIQEKKVIIGRNLEGETGFAGGELFLSSGQAGCMHYGLGQVPTELEHGAVGPVNETPGIPLSFQLVPAPPITLLIPEITRLICYNRLPPLSH